MDGYAVLAARDIVAKIPMVALIVFGAILLVAFFIGFKKGFRRVGWGGLFWAIAGVGYVVADKFLRNRNPLKGVLEKKFGAELAAFGSSLSIGLACVLVALLLYGVFATCLRPRMKWVKNRDVEYDEYGFAYEVDSDYDDYDDARIYGKKFVKKGYGKPCVFMRVLGGLACTVNAAAVLAAVVAPCLLAVDVTSLKDGVFGAIFQSKIAVYGLKYAARFFLDFLTLGIIFAVAFRGYKAGFVDTLRALLVWVGGIGGVAGCFALPFARYASKVAVTRVLVSRCSALGLKLSASFGGVLGKLLAGALLAAALIVAIVILNILLKKLSDLIWNNTFARVFDGCLGCLLWFAFGILLCTALWGVAYAFEYAELFKVSGLFGEKAAISNGAFEAAEEYLKPWLQKLAAKLK